MTSKHHLVRAISLFGAAFVFAAVGMSARAGRLSFDSAGNLFEADGHSVSKYTVDGTKSTFATGFKGPVCLCFDSKGNLFVSDPDSNSIYKLTPEGKKSTFATGISSTGMAFDRSDNLFASEDDSIFKFTPEGVKSIFVSGLQSQFGQRPLRTSAEAVDGTDHLFVIEETKSLVPGGRPSASIVRFSPDGTKSFFASDLEDPIAVAVAGDGNLLVLTAENGPSGSILQFTPDGTKSVFASTLGFASDLVCDHAGNLFVLRTFAHSILKFDSSGIPRTFASDWLSPDKQWEYRGDDDYSPKIVKMGTTEVAVNLSEVSEGTVRATHPAIVWAPDSKRFAFNYSPPHMHHTSWETIALYQLRGDEWEALRSPVDQTSERTQLAQLAQLVKQRLPKSRPDQDILRVRNWTDANTAILYDSSFQVGSRSKLNFLFTLKFDAEGNPKIVKTHQMSDSEVDESNQ
jgi:sugar lactone lactonase YvrE